MQYEKVYCNLMARSSSSSSSSSTHAGSKRWPHKTRPKFASTTTEPIEDNHRRTRSPQKHPSHTMTDASTSTGKSSPRLTHFLTLPIGHHAELRSAISALTTSWLAHEPPIDGIDPSIVVNPHSLHLTLGVMALAPQSPPHNDSDRESELNLAGARTLLVNLAPTHSRPTRARTAARSPR
jgi:hypothetical protein